MGKTLYEKIWESHLVHQGKDGECLVYVDRHLAHEISSPQAFQGLRDSNRTVRRPDSTLAVADHIMPTTPDRLDRIDDEEARIQLDALVKNTSEFGVPYIKLSDNRQGIVHVVGPEQGFTLPGTILACGDSHTSTHGALGCLAFGIGTSEIEHVLATQCHIMRKSKTLLVKINDTLPVGVTAKDMALEIIAKLGTAGGTGYAIEYGGDAVESLSVEGRMTLCNLTIEAGSRTGMVAPDDKTFHYLKNKPYSPKGSQWSEAVLFWRGLRSDPDAVYDRVIEFSANEIEPRVTWGTSPEDSIEIGGSIPHPNEFPDEYKRKAVRGSLKYMDLEAGMPVNEIKIDRVFVGSCTNGRIEDIRDVAKIAKGLKVADWVKSMVVPVSGLVKAQAEKEGLDIVLRQSGFEWREPGCSMCNAINPDKLDPGERCASTSNRNFEGRQGRGGRTHLLSPAMAAAAAIKGYLCDVREFL